MKKTISIVLALALCLSLSVVFTACAHEHSFATEWSKDATHHWHACTGEDCTEAADKAEHAWDAGTVTTLATYAADGTKTFACTECSQTKTESYSVDTVVTEEEWNTAFQFTENYTITTVLTSTVDPEADPYAYVLTRNGDKYHQFTGGVNNEYWSVEDGTCYFYDSVSGGYIKTVLSSQTPETLPTYCSSRVLPTNFRNYSDYQYDEATHTYRVNVPAGFRYTNVYAAFEDGKLVYHTYTYTEMGTTSTTTVTYGTAAEITLPTNIVSQ